MRTNQMMIKWVSATHTFWYRLTGGLIGGRVLWGPVLLLTTTGRKSGRQHTMPLLYLQDDGNLVIIASNGGSDHHPTWYLNLRANPQARVQVRSRQRAVLAETASPTEKARLWPLITKMYRGYQDYQRRTARDIPVVILHPE